MKRPDSIQIGYLDGLRFQRALLAGLKEIISHEKAINKINVFPIPDKDTGSNLKKTFAPVIEKYPSWETAINKISRDIADLALSSALGYSGTIFAQFLSGFAEGMKDYKRISTENIAEATTIAVARAYESLENPQEGTVLTVFKEWSEEVRKLSSKTEDFVLLLRKSLQKAASALKKTPQQLEILRKNKVVDAGGKAFICFLEGIQRYIERGSLKLIIPLKRGASPRRKAAEEEKKAQFCAECCVRRENLDRPGLIERLKSIGQDLIFYGSLNFAKIHIKTYDPGEIFRCAAEFGDVSSKRVFEFASKRPTSKRIPIALVPDTTCDISEEYIENSNIYFVPVKFQAMNKVYTDKVSIIPEEFYQILSSSPVLPKTSQPSLMDFTRIYEHLLIHYQSLISVHVSGKLSGTFQTAFQAANKIAPERITVLDGKNLSVGLGLVVREGIKAIQEGLNQKDVSNRIINTLENTEIFIVIPTLKYLIKGGRLTKTKGFIARILNIIPILSIDREGSLEPVGKIRNRKKLEQKILDMASERIEKAQISHQGLESSGMPEQKVEFSLAVAHTNAPESGKKIVDKLEERLGKKVALIMNASPVLGVHAGPGAIGIAVFKIP